MTENIADIVPVADAPLSNNPLETIKNLRTGANIVSTMPPSPDNSVLLFNAVSNSKQLQDHVGQLIKICHYVAQAVDFVDEDGVVQKGVRLTLIDDRGDAYSCVSNGVLRSIETITALFGDPQSWAEPVEVEVAQEKGNRGFRYLTLHPSKSSVARALKSKAK